MQNISHKKVLKSFPKNSNVLNISAEPIFLKQKNTAMCPITWLFLKTFPKTCRSILLFKENSNIFCCFLKKLVNYYFSTTVPNKCYCCWADLHLVHKFWEGNKILQSLHLTFDWHYIGQKWCGDFAKFCVLLRIYELYINQIFLGYIS